MGSDHSIKYSLIAEESDTDFLPVVVDAAITDDTSPGVYFVSVTLTKAGKYNLSIMLRGLEVPTGLTEIEVLPALNTIALTSNFTGVKEPYITGQKVILTIWARDTFENLRKASVADVFTLTVTGMYTGTDYGNHEAVSLGQGLYTVDYMFEIVEAYKIEVKFGG